MGTPEDPKCTVLKIKVRTVQMKDGRIRIINNGDEAVCDPAKVRRLIKGKRVQTDKIIGNNEELDKETAHDHEVDEILKDYIEKMSS